VADVSFTALAKLPYRVPDQIVRYGSDPTLQQLLTGELQFSTLSTAILVTLAMAGGTPVQTAWR